MNLNPPLKINQNIMYIVYIDSYERLKFFLSLKCVRDNIDSAIFFTIRRGVDKYLKKLGANSILIRKTIEPAEQIQFTLPKCEIEAAYGWSTSEINCFCHQIYSALESFEQRDLEFLIWNSSFIFGQFVKSNYTNSKTIFFENSNFNGKAYANFSGTNAEACLNSFLSSQEIERYFLPQTPYAFAPRDKMKIILSSFFTPKKSYTYRSVTITTRVLNRAIWPIFNKFFCKHTIQPPFILIPLQVPKDSNILKYYRGTIDKFLCECIAENPNKRLVAKFHPKDTDMFSKLSILLKYRSSVQFVDLSTQNLIENAEEIFVINSNVGLEALLAGKKIKVFGEAVYKSIDSKGAQELYKNLNTNLSLKAT